MKTKVFISSIKKQATQLTSDRCEEAKCFEAARVALELSGYTHTIVYDRAPSKPQSSKQKRCVLWEGMGAFPSHSYVRFSRGWQWVLLSPDFTAISNSHMNSRRSLLFPFCSLEETICPPWQPIRLSFLQHCFSMKQRNTCIGGNTLACLKSSECLSTLKRLHSYLGWYP